MFTITGHKGTLLIFQPDYRLITSLIIYKKERTHKTGIERSGTHPLPGATPAPVTLAVGYPRGGYHYGRRNRQARVTYIKSIG